MRFTHPERPGIVFLHIPKTGGLTVRKVLEDQYGPALSTIYGYELAAWTAGIKKMPKDEQRRLLVVGGHMPFGFHEVVPRFSTYFTMLRHPVDRIVSHYFYAKRRPRTKPGRDVAERHLTLEEYVTIGVASALINNGQTRALGQRKFLARAAPATQQTLDVALQRLDRVVVGLVERFDESMDLMAREFGWTVTGYPVVNRTKSRPSVETIPSEAIELITAANAFDLVLYERAQELFAARVGSLSPAGAP
jgi:hypothetical protein